LFPNFTQTIDSNLEESSKVIKSQKQMTKVERRELQEKQRAEKAARIALGGSGKTPKPQKSKPSSPPRTTVEPSLTGYRPPPNKKLLKRQSDFLANSVAVTFFSHLQPFNSDYSTLKEKISGGLIHPAIISLGIQYSEMTIVGGNSRCLAMLTAFKKVISDYVTPSGTSLHRHLIQHISKQVDFLTSARTLAASMRSAIRYVKLEITNLDLNLPDEDVKNR
jgi:translation initiation factor eIF-2B subunit delta